jgi:hypothetical protein
MIVREYDDRFVLIEQDFHARLSGEIMKNLRDDLFKGAKWRKSVNYAITQHDLGWKPFDLEPFWNDKEKRPFSFIDFPVLPKAVIYTYGIDTVEKEDSYAGLLCSSHYERFMARESQPEAKRFVQKEKKRQQWLIQSIPDFDEALYAFHFALLRFGDDISLYLCLNEPGTSSEDIHPFFKKGINVSALQVFNKDYISLHYRDKQTLVIEDFPFHQPFTVTLKQKEISKETIEADGLRPGFQNTPEETVQIYLTGE